MLMGRNGPGEQPSEMIVAALTDVFRYLSGMHPLFEFLQLHVGPSTYFSHGIRAAFWNFARQDFLGSYFTRSATQLDPESRALWCAAGLSINDQGRFQIAPMRKDGVTKEDQAANGVMWLVCKIVNFLAQRNRVHLAQWAGPSHLDLLAKEDALNADQDPRPDPSAWLALCFDLQAWFEGIPETFRPAIRNEHPMDVSKLTEGGVSPFPEIFYGRGNCAAAIQLYHFGRIALLINQPTDVINTLSTSFDRLHGYREITKEVEYHGREICGIALGRPHGGVRIFMTPLLYAVGQCLENAEEHDIIVDLLRGVEADLGWATAYAVQRLQESWKQ
jgi:hypothetical protein